MEFWLTYRSSNLGQITRPYNNQQKRELVKLWTLLSRLTKNWNWPWPSSGIEKLWNMKVTLIPIVIGTLATATKWLLKELEDLEIRGQVEPSQLVHWDRAEYWEESWRLEETCSHSNFSERPSPLADMKNSRVNNTSLSRERQDGKI